ncbi:MAG TPA: GspE/PulE family protein [Candidatus Paceibacterota bacterium]|jgi:type IV pilus assembly protein PilB
MNLLASLVKKNIIRGDEVPAIEQEVAETGDTLENVLLRRGIDPGTMLELRGDTLKVPTREVSDVPIAFEVLSYIPEESARHYEMVPLGIVDGVLEVGMIDPDNIEALDALNFISSRANLPFKVFLITEQDFQRVIKMYQGLSGEVNEALTELESEIAEDVEEATRSGARQKIKEIEDDMSAIDREEGDETTIIKEDAPVSKMVGTILKHAVEGGSSDVHIEPTGEHVRVRFRVDGHLHTSIMLPPKVHRAVVARIKILASIRLDEKRKPQDGRFTTNISGRKIDFRVSTFPTFYGEKVVMRILDPDKGVYSLEDIGFSKRNLALIRSAIQRPYGIVLISGPTGSGKTSTLYAMLKELDREKWNVLSLEDPVEYNIEGVSQSQVRPEIGYTFATGLRTTLRQDPDIIMVGEIRDKETAQLAIQAALTGHLVLSTIHTNNAIGVIPRLVDMGVDPYLIAPTLVVAMAQRLVRRLCPNTGKKVPIEGSRKIMLDKQFEDLPEKYRKEIPRMDYVYDIESTKECPSGTRGRIAVFEMFGIDKDIERVILKDANSVDLWEVARKKGMLSMKEDAIIKALQGTVPFEEVSALGTDLSYEEVPATNGGESKESVSEEKVTP